MVSFVQSIMWIQFTSDCIIDMLQIFGFISGLPPALFGLTVLAWGNCLGDMSADVAMTKKGFGEMAITGTMAGPIFNILVGQGLSLTIGILGKGSDPETEGGIMDQKFEVSAFNKDDDGNIIGFDYENATIPVTLLISLSMVLIILLINGLSH